MKKHYLILSVLSFCFCLSKAQLTYTVVTNGLNSVSFEGGGAELECGDVDGDGDLDLVTIGSHGSPNINATEAGIMVWKNNGNGTSWSLSQSGSFGYGGVALGDVNNDGKMDVGYAMHHNYGSGGFGDQLIEVALGNGTGSSWTQYDGGLATNGETYGMSGIDFADINNDGLLDLASNSFSCCAGIHAYKNNGNGTWTQTWGMTGGNGFNMSALGDFNRDGNVDWFTSSEIGNAWKNTGGGSFVGMQTGIPKDWSMRFDLGDVNNDGATDVAVFSIMVGTIQDLKVYTYDISASKWKSISTGLPNPATGVINVKLADMDMDGNVDLLTWSNDSLRIYKGNGAGVWTPNGGIAKPETGVVGWTTGDFNHDGYTDIACIAAGTNGGVFKVYLNVHTAHDPLSILPVSPKGFECYAPGSAQFVKWLSVVPSGPIAHVTIEFSSTGTAGPWTTVVTNAPNSGTYQWAVPNVSSPNCYLKYTISNGSAPATVITSNAFGVGSCTSATGTNEITEINSQLSVYPNPMNESTTISIQDWNINGHDRQLKIYDVVGSVVYQQTINTQVTTITPALSAGVYFVEVRGTESVMKEKIVVVK
jgi:hypothetical protein